MTRMSLEGLAAARAAFSRALVAAVQSDAA